MKYCPNCKVRVGAPLDHCPLCQNELLPDSAEQVEDYVEVPYFPENVAFRRKALAYKIQLFSVLVVGVLCGMVDFFFDINKGLHWSVVIIIWCLAVEAVVRPIMKTRIQFTPLFNRILGIAGIASLVSFWYVGHLDLCVAYVLPALIIISLIANAILGIFEITGNTMAYTLGSLAFGLIPNSIMSIMGIDTPMLWGLASILSIIAILALGIFRGGKVLVEIQKRLSV